MARKLNHTRVDSKKKAIASHRAEIEQRAEFTWRRFNFKKHRAVTMPELIFKDPEYFYWLAKRPDLVGHLEHQLNIVADRAAHIFPPDKAPDQFEFAIRLNRSGGLKKISVKRNLRPNSRQGTDLIRLKHLDLGIIDHFDNRQESGAILIAFLKASFFDDPDADLRARQCEAFFEEDAYFDLTCRERHCVLGCA
jgi:hypothetical protein